MKPRYLIFTLIFLTVFFLAVSSVTAASPGRYQIIQTDDAALQPGNYCISCHLDDDPRLYSVSSWQGGIGSEVNSPCPAERAIHEEYYYTERLLLMIDRADAAVGPLSEKTQIRLEDNAQRYSRMLDVPVTSLDALVSEAQTTRFQLNKVYSALNQMAERSKQRTIFVYTAVITLIVLGSLAWGLYNTRAVRSGMKSKSWAVFWRVFFVLAVLGFFAMPIFRVPVVEVAMATAEQQASQATLDTAQRAAATADRAQARAWMLSQIGTAWGELEASQGSKVLEDSREALEDARENEVVLWGQSLAVQEVTVGTRIEMETAGLIAADLNAVRARAWALPRIAQVWNESDPVTAAALLQDEQVVLDSETGLYRDLQLRGLALAWTDIDIAQSASTAAQIGDPALRAWTYRELAQVSDKSTNFDRAAEAASEIEDPIQRARVLREIAVTSGNPTLFDEALASLDGVSGAPLAYALSDLAAASRNSKLVEQIDPSFPDALALARLRLGEYQLAWESADQIADPYEQAHAQAVIAGLWANSDAAMQIKISFYRDIALRDVIRKTGNQALVESIASNYYKVQALTSLGDYEAATQLAGELGETFPLVELAQALASEDPQAALALVDQMGRESDKAKVLRHIAVASLDQTIIEQAQGMALAARVRGDALAPAQASLELAQSLLEKNNSGAAAAFRQAYEAAQRIATK